MSPRMSIVARSLAVALAGAAVTHGCSPAQAPADPAAPGVELRASALTSFSKQMSLPMLDLLRLGHAVPTVNTPFDLGTLNSVFDGDVTTLARTPAVNPLVVTMAFDASIAFKQTRMYLATPGTLTLEVAATLADLNGKTGSYSVAVDNQALVANSWGSWTFTATGKYVRATVKRTDGQDFVHVNEWELAANVTVNAINVVPTGSATGNSAKMITGRALQLTAKYADANKYTYPIADTQTWSSSNTGVANVVGGRVTAGGTPGSATLTVTVNGLSSTVALTVASSFAQTPDAARTRKVAFVRRDPLVPSSGNVPMHQAYGWSDPNADVTSIVSKMASASGNTVNYVVVETDDIDAKYLYTQYNGSELSFADLVSMYDQGRSTWGPLLDAASKSGNIAFEYQKLLADLKLCEKRDSGQIDEVWVYTDPFGGMYESALAGAGAFPYNSPPLTGTSCNGQLPIMGFNYEASLPNAIHSFGHRIEAVMTQVYGRWDHSGSNPSRNDWEKFSTIDSDRRGQGHVGYTHFPVNGTPGTNGLGYDYANTTQVTSFEPNWQYYPFLQDLTSTVSCATWSCGGDSDDKYYQFMYGHLPRFTGVSDGLLNDWWAYFLDFPSASAAARDLGAGNAGNATLGFENTSGWTASAGTKAQDTTAGERVQGAASLKMTGLGSTLTLTSGSLASTAVTVAANLSVDVRVPTQMAGLTGATVKLCLKSPTRTISSYVCSSGTSLDGVGVSTTPTFFTVPWTIPAATLSALQGGSFSDLQIQVTLGGIPSAAQSAAWIFDRGRFFGP